MRTIAQLEAERDDMFRRARENPQGAPLYLEIAHACNRQIMAQVIRNEQREPIDHVAERGNT